MNSKMAGFQLLDYYNYFIFYIAISWNLCFFFKVSHRILKYCLYLKRKKEYLDNSFVCVLRSDLYSLHILWFVFPQLTFLFIEKRKCLLQVIDRCKSPYKAKASLHLKKKIRVVVNRPIEHNNECLQLYSFLHGIVIYIRIWYVIQYKQNRQCVNCLLLSFHLIF